MNRCAQTVVPSRDWEDGGGSDRFLDEGASQGLGSEDSRHALHTSVHGT